MTSTSRALAGPHRLEPPIFGLDLLRLGRPLLILLLDLVQRLTPLLQDLLSLQPLRPGRLLALQAPGPVAGGTRAACVVRVSADWSPWNS
jgi:hypothetical protein